MNCQLLPKKLLFFLKKCLTYWLQYGILSVSRDNKRKEDKEMSKKKKPTKSPDWLTILIGALVDLAVGIILLLIGKTL